MIVMQRVRRPAGWRHRGAVVPAAAIALALTLPPAQAVCSRNDQPDFWQQQRLLDGCWRDELEERGFTVDGDIIVEFVRNSSGGRTRNGASAWRATAGLSLDLGKIHGLYGSRFRVSGAWNEGDNLGTDIETIFNPSEIFGLRGPRLWELYWGQEFADGQIDLIVGRHSPADHFNVQPVTFNTVNLAFYSMSLLYNDFAFRSRPVGMWGVSGKVDPHDSPLYLKGGVFSGAPRDLQRTSAHGLDFRIDLDESTLGVLELGYETGAAHGLPGTYRAGLIANSARFTSLTNPAETKRGNFNLYLSADQALTREPGSDSEGLDGFVMVNVPTDKDITLIESYVVGGLVYTGLFDGHDQDRTYVGAAYAKLNEGVETLADEVFHGLAIAPNEPNEAMVEIGHAFQVTPFWTVTPAAQFIINPGLTDDVDGAVVLGLQTALTF